MRTERIITLALVVGVSGASLSSCGDEAEALSKPEFVEQADAICQAADDEITPIFDAAFEGFEDLDWDDPANEGLIFDKFAEAASQAGPIWHQSADDIRDLNEPEEDRELIGTLLDDLDEAVNELVETTAAAADGDEAAMRAIDEGTEDPLDDVNRRAREYGFTVCGEEG